MSKHRPSRTNVLPILNEKLEPLNDILIDSLVEQGYSSDELIDLRNQGYQYNRRRASFMTPWHSSDEL